MILAGRVFWSKARDPASWNEFIDYGLSIGVERGWTERIPTRLPIYVQEACERFWQGKLDPNG